MPSPVHKREVGRGERVLPGIWRLRLPLPWPGVPHCNAWAIAAGDGVVLFDTGMHEPGSLAQLERAMAQVNLKIEHVRLLVCTHAHSDHYGQAATIMERAGCALWMHGDHAHMTRAAADPEAALQRRLEVALQSGVPAEPLQAYKESRKGQGFGIADVVLPDVVLEPGTTVSTDLGEWTVHETPGHAPSHVCLHQAEKRLLISGDHVLGRVAPYFDFGWSPDPVGEFLRSLDRVDDLDARLCLPGHGRTFSDVAGHVHANRIYVAEKLAMTREILRETRPTAFEALPKVFQVEHPAQVQWRFTELLAYLRHLEVLGDAERVAGAEGEPETWRLP